MAFVNGYISKEDEKKFIAPLDLFRKMEGFPSPPYNWTRDAGRELWLTKLCQQRPGMGGGYHAEWLLYDQGRYYEFFLDDDTNFGAPSVTWTFFGFNPRFAPIPPEEEQARVLQLLKELLTAYGYAGAIRQQPTTTITFTNF